MNPFKSHYYWLHPIEYIQARRSARKYLKEIRRPIVSPAGWEGQDVKTYLDLVTQDRLDPKDARKIIQTAVDARAK